MNLLQRELTKLEKVANKVAVRGGFKRATVSSGGDHSQLFVCLWDGDMNIVGSEYCRATPKIVKQTMTTLVREIQSRKTMM